MRNMLQSRVVSEQQANSSTPTQNRILAGGLHQLLEDRKFVKTRAELAKLANRYDMDLDLVERLAQRFKTPTMDEESRRMVTNDKGEERMIVMVSNA